MKKLMVDFICQELGKDFDCPRNYSLRIDDYMAENDGGFCDACEEGIPEANPAECWKKYFELRFAEENKEGKNNENKKEKARTGN